MNRRIFNLVPKAPGAVSYECHWSLASHGEDSGETGCEVRHKKKDKP